MIVDMKTAVLSYAIINVVCMLVMVLLWFQNRKRFAGLDLWLASFSLQVAGLLLIFLRGILPDLVTIVVGNAALVAGAICMFVGLERFVDKRRSQVRNYVLFGAFVLIHAYFTFGVPSLLGRDINSSLAILLTSFQSAWLLLRRVEGGMRRITGGPGIIFSMYCLISLARILEVLVVPPGNDFLHPGLSDMLLLLLYQVMFILLTFSLFLTVNRRLVIDLEDDVAERKRAEEAMRQSEGRFRSLVEQAGDGFELLDAGGRYVDVNAATCRMLGYTHEELLELTVPDIDPQNDQARFSNMFRSIVGQPPLTFETRHRRKDGSLIQVEVTASILQVGEDPFALSLVRDIGERKQAQEALRESERRYRSLFDNMLDGYAYCLLIYEGGQPQDFIYLEVNSAFENITGLKDVTGKRVSEVVPGLRTSSPELFETYGRVAQTGKPEKFETYLGAMRAWFSISVYSPEPEHFVAVFENITARKQAESDLRKLSRAVEQSPASVIITDTSGAIEYVNPGFCQVTGYRFEEVQGKNPRILRSTGASPEVYQELWSAIAAGRTWQGEFQNQKKNGEPIWESAKISPIMDEHGNITHFVSVQEDITGRKRMDASLRYRNDVLAALHHVTLDLINRHDVDDILEALLKEISALLNAPQISIDLIEGEDVLVTRAVTPGQPLQKGDSMRQGEGGWLSWQAVETGKPAVLEDYATWSQRRPLHEGFPVHAILIVPIHHGSQVIGAINVSRSEAGSPFSQADVEAGQELAQLVALVLDNAQLYSQLKSELAERTRSEEALRLAQAQLIDQQRTTAVYAERQRLARDLHDSVNQSIHSLVLFSETLGSVLQKNHPERAQEIAERLQESARQALKEVRLLLYQLQPSKLGNEMDLIRDLEVCLATVERRAGVQAEIVQKGSMDKVPPEWLENLFWITIEALNNSLKHSAANSVKVIVRGTSQQLELEVLDNGKGFDPARARAGGLGLGTMRERAALLGGKLTILSTPGKGTHVRFIARLEA